MRLTMASGNAPCSLVRPAGKSLPVTVQARAPIAALAFSDAVRTRLRGCVFLAWTVKQPIILLTAHASGCHEILSAVLMGMPGRINETEDMLLGSHAPGRPDPEPEGAARSPGGMMRSRRCSVFQYMFI